MNFRQTQLSAQLARLPTMPQQTPLGGLLCEMSHCTQKEEVANDGQFVPFTHAISDPRVAGGVGIVATATTTAAKIQLTTQSPNRCPIYSHLLPLAPRLGVWWWRLPCVSRHLSSSNTLIHNF